MKVGNEYEIPTCPEGNGVGVTMVRGLVAELMANAGVLTFEGANRGAGAVVVHAAHVTGPREQRPRANVLDEHLHIVATVGQSAEIIAITI